jgi:predicted flap endonuclease-1-like 5' DNA nuclease
MKSTLGVHNLKTLCVHVVTSNRRGLGMSITKFLAWVFLLIFSVTFIFQNLPPGALMTVILHQSGLPVFPDLVPGVSLDLLLNSTLNGILWAGAILLLYIGRRRLLQRRKRVPSEHFIATPRPRPTRKHLRQGSPKVTTKADRSIYSYVSLEQDIEAIEGIGPIYGHRFRGLGVAVVGDLLRKGATPIGRSELARRVEVSTTILKKWVNQADFFRLRGVGTQYADLITATGVETVIDLSTRSPKDLYQQIRIINLNKNLVRRTPPLQTLRRWIHHAKRLTPVIKY